MGAGLVTVATAKSALPLIAMQAPELMTDALEETATGAIADQKIEVGRKNVMAIGPGMGTEAATVALTRRLFFEMDVPIVVDADALNALAESDWQGPGAMRVLTPHPGEMGRLTRGRAWPRFRAIASAVPERWPQNAESSWFLRANGR